MRVAIADDSPPFRGALATLLASIGADVVVSAGTPRELVAAIHANPPHVAIVDMRMPPTRTNEGLLTTRQINVAYPEVAVLVVTADEEAPYAADVLAGAPRGTGYMTKRSISNRRHLHGTLTRLVSGCTVVDSDVALQLLSHPSLVPGLRHLDDQQRRILLLLAQDYSLAAVAEHLGTNQEHAAELVVALSRILDLGTGPDKCRAVLRWMTRRPQDRET